MFGTNLAQQAGNTRQLRRVNEAELYTYVGDFPTTRADRSLEVKQRNKSGIGLGTIVLTSMFDNYEPEIGVPTPADDPSTIVTFEAGDRFSEACIRRFRPFIVVDKTEAEDIFVALPVFTYGTRGLNSKPDFYYDIHLHVNDLRRCATQQEQDRIQAAENNGSSNLYAIMYGSVEENGLIRPEAHCRFDYPITFNLLTKKMTVLGKLTEFSAKKLFVRHYQSAARRLAPPQVPGAGNGGGGGGGGVDSGNNDDSQDPGRDSANPRGPRTPPRGDEPTRSPRTRSTSDGATQSQSSPGLRLSGLALTSPRRRWPEDEADDRSSSRSSKRQRRSSSPNDLMELDDAGRPRTQTQSRSGSMQDPETDQTDHTATDPALPDNYQPANIPQDEWTTVRRRDNVHNGDSIRTRGTLRRRGMR